MGREWYTVEEVSNLLGISKYTVRENDYLMYGLCGHYP